MKKVITVIKANQTEVLKEELIESLDTVIHKHTNKMKPLPTNNQHSTYQKQRVKKIELKYPKLQKK